VHALKTLTAISPLLATRTLLMGLYSTFVEKVHVLDRREMCWVERRRVFDVMRRTNMAVGQLQITYSEIEILIK
jgi:hypothetical protein